jgi:hypothetical protein
LAPQVELHEGGFRLVAFGLWNSIFTLLPPKGLLLLSR